MLRACKQCQCISDRACQFSRPRARKIQVTFASITASILPGAAPAHGRRRRVIQFGGRHFMRKSTTIALALGFSAMLAGTADAQIKMGVGGPFTGPNASFGAQIKNGADQAIED